jgi:hypothetical protein
LPQAARTARSAVTAKSTGPGCGAAQAIRLNSGGPTTTRRRNRLQRANLRCQLMLLFPDYNGSVRVAAAMTGCKSLVAPGP